MKNLGKIVLTLLAAFLITFLAGLAWGNYRARQVTTADDVVSFVASEAGFEKGTNSRYYKDNGALEIHIFSFACKDWDYYYLAPLEMSSKMHVPRTGFFANYDNTLTWAMFGTGLLAGQAREIVTHDRRAWELYALVAAAAYGAVEGYRQGFNQSVDCGLIDKTLDENRWRLISQKIEIRHQSHMPPPLVFHLGSQGITKCRTEGTNASAPLFSMVTQTPKAACADFSAGDVSKKLYLVFAYTGAKPNRSSVYARMISTRLEPMGAFALAPRLKWTSSELDTPKQYFTSERGVFSLPLKTDVPPGIYETSVVVDGADVDKEIVQIPVDLKPLAERQLGTTNWSPLNKKSLGGYPELDHRRKN